MANCRVLISGESYMASLLENPLQYCREKVCGHASSLHYAVLFQTEDLKAFWLGCFTLHHELRQACLKQLDAGLTQVKLGWWSQALNDWAKNSNSHPVITALSWPVLERVATETWPKLINAVVNSCEPKRFNSPTDWYHAVHSDIEPWMAILQARCCEPEKNFKDLLVFWTHATQLCQLLRLAKYLDEGFQPLPIDILAQYGVTAEQIKKRTHNVAISNMFKTTAYELVHKANAAWGKTPLVVRLFARPLRALFRMRVAELQLHESSGYKLLREQKTITPFKKFTISWTTHVLRW